MRDEAERRIGHLYPKAKLADGSNANVIAWIWARTVTCPNPACGVEMPLVRSWWLGKKKGKEAYVVPRVRGGRVEFEIGHDVAGAPTKADDGTVTRNGARCVACGTAVPLAYVRTEGKGGRIGARLMAIAAEGNRRRHYLAPTEEHEAAARVPIPDGAPDTELPDAALGFRVQGYGMTHHADLFTPRQLTALTTFSDLVAEAREKALDDARSAGFKDGAGLDRGGTSAEAYADSIACYLGLLASRILDRHSSVATWDASPSKEQVRGVFARQAISMVWDFAESAHSAHPAATSMRVWSGCLARSPGWRQDQLDRRVRRPPETAHTRRCWYRPIRPTTTMSATGTFPTTSTHGYDARWDPCCPPCSAPC